MSPLRKRMLEDMKLAGLADSTQKTYINAVEKLGYHYGNRSPAKLSEEEVRGYFVERVENQAVARGTFKTDFFGIKFLYGNTLDVKWDLFSKKRFACRNKNVFQRSFLMMKFAAFSV
jgi:hypothetical protein